MPYKSNVLINRINSLVEINKKKVLILGHSGFIGSHLFKTIHKIPGWEIIGLSFPEIDLSKKEQADRLLPYLAQDTILIIASWVKRQYGDDLKTYIFNNAIIENICDALQKNPVKRIIFMSSAAVYGEETENLSITERTPVNPTSYYGISKYTAERLLKKTCSKIGLTSLVCLRPPLIYGIGDKGSTYGPSGFFDAAINQENIVLWGDGSELREFVYIEDICKGIEHLISSEVEGEFNFVSGKSNNFLEIIEILKESYPNLKVSSRQRSKEKVDNQFIPEKILEALPSNFEFESLAGGLLKMLQFRVVN